LLYEIHPCSISKKFLYNIQQMQVKRLSSKYLQGPTVIKLFNHLKHSANNNNMHLLIYAYLDLFRIDICSSSEQTVKNSILSYMLHCLNHSSCWNSFNSSEVHFLKASEKTWPWCQKLLKIYKPTIWLYLPLSFVQTWKINFWEPDISNSANSICSQHKII
jgi:hypothetical protein